MFTASCCYAVGLILSPSSYALPPPFLLPSLPLSLPPSLHLSSGKGRGRQVIAVARTADVILMMLDAGKGEVQRQLLEKELESVGIRLNKQPPNIYFKVGEMTLHVCICV